LVPDRPGIDDKGAIMRIRQLLNDFVVGSLGSDIIKGGPGYDTCVGTENVINCEVIS
jgi:hypothetical protein